MRQKGFACYGLAAKRTYSPKHPSVTVKPNMTTCFPPCLSNTFHGQLSHVWSGYSLLPSTGGYSQSVSWKPPRPHPRRAVWAYAARAAALGAVWRCLAAAAARARTQRNSDSTDSKASLDIGSMAWILGCPFSDPPTVNNSRWVEWKLPLNTKRLKG